MGRLPRRKSQVLQDNSPPPVESDNGSDNEASNSHSPVAATPASGSQTPQFPIKRRRGRPSKASLLAEARMLAGSPPNDPNGDEEDYSEPGTPTTSTPNNGKKRRGRPPASARGLRNRGGPSHVTAIPRDEAGNEQEVVNDEIVLPIDEAGEQKVDKNGRLLGGREYRCRTFTVKGRGERLYMLSTEPARCMGFRDSYLLFQRHKKLFKIIADDDEKFDMIDRKLIPHSYKGRAIGIVTARSIFREFGAKIVVGGRKVIDDYYETEARERGDVEGEIADPTDKLPLPGQEYNRNQYVAWHGASSVYHTGQPTVPTVAAPIRRKKVPITSENWMLEHAQAASRFNAELAARRKVNLEAGGQYEPHTNLMHVPANTQPTTAVWSKYDDKPAHPIGYPIQVVDTVMTLPAYTPTAPAAASAKAGGGAFTEDALQVLISEFGENAECVQGFRMMVEKQKEKQKMLWG